MFKRVGNFMRSLWAQLVSKPQPEILREDINIEEWKRIFQGKSDWLDYSETNVDGVTRKRVMKTMNSAKLLCQKMATLIYSEEPRITGGEAIMDVLKKNRFLVNQPEDIERQIALGGQVVKQYVKDGKIEYDYVTADNFIPISWDNSGIYEAAFLDHRVIRGKEYIRVETHKLYFPEVPVTDDNGNVVEDSFGPVLIKSDEPAGYEITNELYKAEYEKMTKVDIEGLIPEVVSYYVVPITEPLFAYCKNPICNNMTTTSPIGISIYANCKDTLQALDVAFNNMAEAPELCKPRIVVSDKLTRVTYDSETGKKKRIFDTQDRVYRTAPMTGEEKAPIQDLTIPLEHDPIRQQIQTLLDLLCIQTGLSTGTLSFDSATGTITATQVISQNSETYKTRQKYVNAITEFYQQIFSTTNALVKYEGIGVTSDISIVWDDSIIEDRTADAAYWIGLYQAKMCARWEAIMNIRKVSESEAKRIDAAIPAETQNINFME